MRSRTVLAVGDSHTYGVFFGEAEAYPGRLDALLAERAPGDTKSSIWGSRE